MSVKYINRDRTYRLIDFLVIPFRAAPVPACGKCVNMLLSALMTTAQAMATALFVDTALAIFRGKRRLPRDFHPAHLPYADCGIRYRVKYSEQIHKPWH